MEPRQKLGGVERECGWQGRPQENIRRRLTRIKTKPVGCRTGGGGSGLSGAGSPGGLGRREKDGVPQLLWLG